jgi:hypothetical protein
MPADGIDIKFGVYNPNVRLVAMIVIEEQYFVPCVFVCMYICTYLHICI